MKQQLKPQRVFSEGLKRSIVKDIETGRVQVTSVSREYSVTRSSIYKWLNKYSRHLQSGQTLVLQMDSEAYHSKELQQRIAELEAALGRKQLEVDFLNQLLEQGKKQLGVDLKKKFFTPPSTGSNPTKDVTPTK